MMTLSGRLTIIVIASVLFGAVFGTFFRGLAYAEDQCFVVTGSAWGGYCDGDKASIELDVKNICAGPLALLYCLEQEGGAWDCQILERVASGETTKVHSCRNTGRFKLVACEDRYDCELEMRKQK